MPVATPTTTNISASAVKPAVQSKAKIEFEVVCVSVSVRDGPTKIDEGMKDSEGNSLLHLCTRQIHNADFIGGDNDPLILPQNRVVLSALSAADVERGKKYKVVMEEVG